MPEGNVSKGTHYRLCSIDQPTPNPGISCELTGNTDRYALVTNEALRFEKQPVEVQDFREITDRFRGLFRIYLEKSPWTLLPVAGLHVQPPCGCSHLSLNGTTCLELNYSETCLH
jgi:hypothetical protein